MSTSNKHPIDHWPARPYPGERPAYSWRLAGHMVHHLIAAGRGWMDAATGEDLDLGERVFILAYGSNANPGKLLSIDAVILQAEITDARAVWCNARRGEGSVVATLVEAPGHVEPCPILAVTPEDLWTVDDWEFPAYERVPFWGRCTLENGTRIASEANVGGPLRSPLVIDGSHVGLHDFDHAYVDALVAPR